MRDRRGEMMLGKERNEMKLSLSLSQSQKKNCENDMNRSMKQLCILFLLRSKGGIPERNENRKTEKEGKII